jgi:hypothetical protein
MSKLGCRVLSVATRHHDDGHSRVEGHDLRVRSSEVAKLALLIIMADRNEHPVVLLLTWDCLVRAKIGAFRRASPSCLATISDRSST